MTIGGQPDLLVMLRDAAIGIGASVADASPHLLGSRFNSEVLSDAILGSSLRKRDDDLPPYVRAIQLDGFPVLIGVLIGSAEVSNIGPQLRRYRNQATIARSWLGPEAPNLHLFLIGPIGALLDADWRQLAAEIESDDRVCRKQVWLPAVQYSPDDAREFLARTFIARPWPAVQRTGRLDTMANLSLPNGWEEVLQDQDLDFNGLVEQLIALEDGEVV